MNEAHNRAASPPERQRSLVLAPTQLADSGAAAPDAQVTRTSRGDNARDADAVRDERMARLVLVARALTGGLDPEETIGIVLSQGMSELDADGAVVLLKDSHERLLAAATTGTATEIMSNVGPIEMGRHLPVTAAVNMAAAIWVSSRGDALDRFPELLVVAPNSAAWAALPLVANGEAFGALGISFATARPFGPAEREFLASLADIAAPSLLASIRTGALHVLPKPPTQEPDHSDVARTIGGLFGMSLTLGSIVSGTAPDSEISRRLLEVIDQLDATSVRLRRSIVAMDTRVIDPAEFTPRPATSPPERTAYDDAIDAMIATSLADAAADESSATVGADGPEHAPGPTVEGLLELCGELLRRYERLSAFNDRRQPALGSLEHLVLLQRLRQLHR